MSSSKKTCKRPKGNGYDWWSRRPGKGLYNPSGSKFGKRLTHKAERREGVEQVRKGD
jgi:hypothetical protein